jgi:hypothetical protein
MFDIVVSRHGRRWEWRVDDSSGKTVLSGRESKRQKARYQSERALFLLLLTTKTPELDREDNL